MLAIQAQDFPGAKWALGLRAPGTTLAEVDAALAAGSIVRSWPMRGTLHLTPAEDLEWMLALMAPRVLAGLTKRQRELELDAKALGRAREVAERALAGTRLDRPAMFAALDKAKLNADPHRGYHMLFYLAQTGVICMGPDDCYVLVAEWIKTSRALDREQALGELALRYFRSHGPATVADLQRWGKLTAGDAKLATQLAAPELANHEAYYFDEATLAIRAPTPVLALPGFDELILGYEDRTCTLPPEHAGRIVPGGNGMFISTVVANGAVVGTWARTQKPKQVAISAKPFAPWPAAVANGFARAAAAYGAFVGKAVTVA
ncbi:MAG: winged helix DNA-binding domain-containing protein [Kofleriaceae bacterium]